VANDGSVCETGTTYLEETEESITSTGEMVAFGYEGAGIGIGGNIGAVGKRRVEYGPEAATAVFP
jgi:hypothetical protein